MDRNPPHSPHPPKTKPGIDWDAIARFEGNVLDGYVPRYKNGQVMGHSGVTIGVGFDIGQHNDWEIKHMPISATLKAKLLPYTSMTGQAAVDFLAKHPLHITPDEGKALMLAVQGDQVKKVNKFYNAHAAGHDAFKKLNSKAQTAVASLYFQHGEKTAVRFRHEMKNIHAGRLFDAAKQLYQHNDGYLKRHQQEATLISPTVKQTLQHAKDAAHRLEARAKLPPESKPGMHASPPGKHPPHPQVMLAQNTPRPHLTTPLP